MDWVDEAQPIIPPDLAHKAAQGRWIQTLDPRGSRMTILKPTAFLLGTPLYAKSTYEGEQVWDVLNVLYYAGTYDSYCTKCRRESTFQVEAPARPSEFVRNPAKEKQLKLHGIEPELPRLEVGVYVVHAHCTRTDSHNQDFVFFADREIDADASPPKVFERSRRLASNRLMVICTSHKSKNTPTYCLPRKSVS